MPKVIDGLAEEFLRLYKAVSNFSRNGAVQAHIELGALRECTALYASPRSEQLFDDAQECFSKLSKSLYFLSKSNFKTCKATTSTNHWLRRSPNSGQHFGKVPRRYDDTIDGIARL